MAFCMALTTNDAGCELSEGCSGSSIGDTICSVGNGLTCQCQYPQLTGDGTFCYEGMYIHTLYIMYIVHACCIMLQYHSTLYKGWPM